MSVECNLGTHGHSWPWGELVAVDVWYNCVRKSLLSNV